MTVQGGTTVTPAEFTTLTTTIGSIPSHATLERLALTITNFTRITFELDTLLTLPPSAFKPLYALSRLRNFEFQCTHGVVLLDDVAFTQMARAWPDLEDLSLKCRRPHVGRVTLAGVLELARRCRSLKSVRIALADVDHGQCASLLARLKSGSLSAGAPVTSQHAITLDVGRPSIGEEDVSTVAEILTRAIPGLTALRHHWSYVSRGSNRNRPPSHEEMMTHRWDAVMRCIVAARGGGLPSVY
ncbi:hypothetical protein BN946_scf184940.g105 [Trametes cinnabarina]|uniref:F-box domain-containing protein n=1 Tax=Pycnoporus cinnabarinus TaxID=5643 RepID=A0A060SHQ4_PYCCI|nr:hypothetical protein BN946_scf184940.g105 [Trametes cinnabarina]